MNKYKLSPQEYRQMLSKVELDSITLVETRAKYSETSFSDNIDISIKETSKSAIDQGMLKIYLSNTFLAKNKQSGEEYIKLLAKYRIDFKNDMDPIEISEEFLKILTENTVKMTIWPYFRQELSDLVSKMNLPAFILPLKRK
jgi:preprotein translocase subunit SecB